MKGAGTRRDVGLVLAGGGNRAFYALGVLNGWWPSLADRIGTIAACSAGACVAAMFLAGRRAEARAVFLERTRGLTRNITWSNLLRGRRLAPHGDVYREIMLAIGRDGGLDRIRQHPFPIHVLASEFPAVLPAGAAAAVGIAAYQLEKLVRSAFVHPRAGRALGFAPAVFDMRACESPEALADLVLASSATPPFTPVGRFGGRPLLDGGMVDNAPAFVAEHADGVDRVIVLLTRPYAPALTGRHGARLYVAPSSPVPAGRWDYTKPDSVEGAVALGERDAASHAAELTGFLGSK